MFLYFCLWLFKSLSQMAFYFSNLILQTASNKNDYVMDFFAGSGSTLATAMKMSRKFIAIEQINEQIIKINKRLNNVIHGDQTGISKEVNWQGGGSFVYTELMK